MRFLIVLLLAPALSPVVVLRAQAPVVASVVNSISRDTRLSPGLLALISYTSPTASDMSHTSNKPTITVQVGVVPAYVNYWAGVDSAGHGNVIVTLPREAPVGPANLTLANSAGTSPPFAVNLDPYSPALWPDVRSYCVARPSLSDGDGLTLDAVGLGATERPVPTLNETGVGASSTAAKPVVTIGGVAARVLSSELVLSTHGIYRVRIVPGQETPEGLEPMILTMGSISSNVQQVIVGTQNALATGGPLSRVARESMVTATGCSRPLADGAFSSDPRDPETNLLGTTVRITDSAGVEHLAPLDYVSRLQVNYIVPAGAANGPATVTITSGSGVLTTVPLDVQSVSPGVFSQLAGNDGSWAGAALPVGWIVRVRDGAQSIEALRIDQSGKIVPIDMGPETDQLYLVMLGTGFRFRSSIENVKVRIGGIDAPVEYAGPQSDVVGLDQMNVRLPRSLSGSPSSDLNSDPLSVEISVDGKLAHVRAMRFK